MKPVFILQVDAEKNCEVWFIEPTGNIVASGTISDFTLTGQDEKAPTDAPVDVVMSAKWSIKEIVEKPDEKEKV
jgi:hypothetical protein